MTNRALMRLSTWRLGSLALSLTAACGTGVGEDAPNGDEASGDEVGSEGAGGSQGVGEGTADDLSPGEEVDEIEQGADPAGVDFENYRVGALTSPWSVAASLTTRASVEATSDHGNVLVVQGSSAPGEFLIARLTASLPSDVIASVDVNPDPGAAFVWSVHTARYKSRIRLERWPGSARLVAAGTRGEGADCGSLPAGSWTRLTLVIHVQQTPGTFDVLVDGKETACTGLETNVVPPFTLVQISDSPNESWGGDVRFDNIALTAP